MWETRAKPRRRWKKRAAIGLAGTGGLLLLLVVMAPTLVNWGLGQGRVRSAIERRLNGKVAFSRLGLRWFGPQSVEKLRVTGPGGDQVALVDVTVSPGIIALLFGSVDQLEIDLSGRLRGEYEPDGSTSFERLLIKAPGDQVSSPPREPFALRGVPPTTLHVKGLSLELHEARSSRVIEFNDLRGKLAYDSRGGVKVNLKGEPREGETRGSLTIEADVDRLFSKSGGLTVHRATGHIDVQAKDAPLPLGDGPSRIAVLALSAASVDIRDRVEIQVQAEAVLDGVETGRLEAAVAMEDLLQADGSLDPALDSLEGRILVRRAPAALLERWLPTAPVIPSRDLGPYIDLDAEFHKGAEPGLVVSLRTRAAQLELAGRIDAEARSLDADRCRISAEITPELFAAVTGRQIVSPLAVKLDLDRLTLPALVADPAGAIRELSARGTLGVPTPVEVALGEALTLGVRDLNVAFDTPRLGRVIALQGAATVDEAAVDFDVAVPDLIGDGGAFSWQSLMPAGRVRVRGVDLDRLSALLGPQGRSAAQVLTHPIDVTAVATLGADGLHVELDAGSGPAGEGAELSLSATIDAEDHSIRGQRLHLAATLPAELVNNATGMSVDPPPRLELDLDSFSVPGSPRDIAGRLRGAAGTGTFKAVTPLVVAGAVELPPVQVSDLAVRIETEGIDRGVALTGSATLNEAQLGFDLLLGNLFGADGSVSLAAFAPAGIATLRGVRPETLGSLLGSDVIASSLTNPIDAALNLTAPTAPGGEPVLALDVTSGEMSLTARAARSGELLRVAECRGRLPLTPELAAALQRGAPQPLVLAGTALATFDVVPFELSLAPDGATASVLRAQVTVEDAVIAGVAPLVEPVRFTGLSAEIEADLGPARSLAVRGAGRVQAAQDGQLLAVLQYAVAAAGEGMRLRELSAELSGLSVRSLERVLGRLDEVSRWTGDKGDLSITVNERGEAYLASVDVGLPHLIGQFSAKVEGEVVSVNAERTRVTLDRDALEQLLRTQPAVTGAGPGPGLGVEADVPLTLELRRLRMPLALLAGRPFDPAAVELDSVLAGGPLVLVDEAGERSTIDRLEISLRTRDLVRTRESTPSMGGWRARSCAGRWRWRWPREHRFARSSPSPNRYASACSRGSTRCWPTSVRPSIRFAPRSPERPFRWTAR